MKHEFKNTDLIELDHIWSLGQQLVVPENGTIVVAGAYKGRYLRYLSELFPTAWLYGYEPQNGAFLDMKEKLKSNKSIILINKGLATARRLALAGKFGSDGCSVLSMEDPRHTLEMVDAVDALSAGIPGPRIDLLLLNCEGSEWALLPYLLDEMMHHRIASMAIQFHPEYVSPQRGRRVLDYMNEYYDPVYNDFPTWTYWKRRGLTAQHACA